MNTQQITAKLKEAWAQSDQVDILSPFEWIVFSQTVDASEHPRTRKFEYRVKIFKFKSKHGAIMHEKVCDMSNVGLPQWQIGQVIAENIEPIEVDSDFFKKRIAERINIADAIRGLQAEYSGSVAS